jgi:hypothetical protein
LYGASLLSRSYVARSLAASVVLAAVGLLGLLGLGSYQACDVYNPSLLVPDEGGGCQHALPPPPPPAVEEDGQFSFPVIAAFNTIDIGLRSDGGIPPFGYDLDKVCTTPTGPESCSQPKGVPVSYDDEAGRDHWGINLFNALGEVASVGTAQINEGLQKGQYGLLLEITGYNLQANDDHVVVNFYVSNGLERTADGGIPAPQFNGKDLWTIDPGSLSGSGSCTSTDSCQAVYNDNAAYVSGGYVVAHIANPIPIGFGVRSFLGGATMILSGAVIVGELTACPNVPVGQVCFQLVGGTIAGRWGTQNLLSTLASIPDPFVDGGFICGDSGTYSAFKTAACAVADISQSESNDNQNPLANCDAVSMALQFTAVAAQLGGVLAAPDAAAGCMNGTVAFSDTCFH